MFPFPLRLNADTLASNGSSSLAAGGAGREALSAAVPTVAGLGGRR